MLPGGTAVRYTYEVKWKGYSKTTYEPADCLVGWEAEMKKVDEAYAARALLPTVNPIKEVQNRAGRLCRDAMCCRAGTSYFTVASVARSSIFIHYSERRRPKKSFL